MKLCSDESMLRTFARIEKQRQMEVLLANPRPLYLSVDFLSCGIPPLFYRGAVLAYGISLPFPRWLFYIVVSLFFSLSFSIYIHSVFLCSVIFYASVYLLFLADLSVVIYRRLLTSTLS